MGDREMLAGLRDVALASPLFAGAPLVRPWHLRWGATSAEVEAPMPGDELVPRTSFRSSTVCTVTLNGAVYSAPAAGLTMAMGGGGSPGLASMPAQLAGSLPGPSVRTRCKGTPVPSAPAGHGAWSK